MIKHKKPSLFGVIDMFKWWWQTTKKDKPYLKATNYAKIRRTNVLGKHRDVEIISINKDELEFLRKKVLELDQEIMELEQSDLKKFYFTETTHKISRLKKQSWEIEQRIKYLEKADPNGKKVLMSYKLFCKIVDTYNHKVIKALVDDAASVALGNNLGYLYVYTKKKENPFTTQNINWAASNKYKQELIDKGETPKDENNPNGKNWFIFYEDTDYVRVAWTKKYGTCKVPNNSVYAFYPTRSLRGIKRYLYNAIKTTPYLMEKFINTTKKAA